VAPAVTVEHPPKLQHAAAAEYIGSSGIAAIAGISRQAVEEALLKVAVGERSTWRGAMLQLRIVPGRGGRSGVRYEVAVDSLPADLQFEIARRNAASLDPSILRVDTPAGDWRSFWTSTLAPALAHPARSVERSAAIKAIAGRLHFTPDGGSRLFDERTVRRYLARYDTHGVAGFQKRTRRDRGRQRCLISSAWDSAVPFDLETRLRLVDETTELVRGLWRSGSVLSIIIRRASEDLLKRTRAAGFDPGYRELRRLCRVPRSFVEPHRALRKVDRFERDRKAHEDAKPRIRRTRDGLAPMELVVGDVHHLDIYVRREDGRLATPKMVAWLDMATMRVFADVFLPEINLATNRSRSMTNAHVIASFIRMTQNPSWGMPRRLYLDNGSEYNWADFIDGALRLSADDGLASIERTASPIVRARPYNAPAKIIEGVFGLLERNYFSEIPGFIGGDRMASKTANVGEAPEPFPGTLDELRAVIAGYLITYETQGQRGGLAGRSPRELYQRAVDDGWSRVAVDPSALRVAFSTEEERHVVQGTISVAGKLWTCDGLQTYLGDRVTVLIPKYEDWSFLPVKDDRGGTLGHAYPDRAYHPLDAEGAREAARRSRRFNKAITEAGRVVPRRNLVGDAMASASLALPSPDAPIGGSVSLADGHAAIGQALQETPEERRRRRQDKINRDQAEHMRVLEKYAAAKKAAKG
jgi:hypothetical protein